MIALSPDLRVDAGCVDGLGVAAGGVSVFSSVVTSVSGGSLSATVFTSIAGAEKFVFEGVLW